MVVDRLSAAMRALTPSSIKAVARFGRDGERGQGMVEYGLILVLIAIVVIVVVGVVGHQINDAFSNVSNGLAA